MKLKRSKPADLWRLLGCCRGRFGLFFQRHEGHTSSTGGFICNTGDTVNFTVGGVNLGGATCASVLEPLQLANSSNHRDDAVINRLMFLQLLDQDNDPSNGIQIEASVKTALSSQSIDFSASATNFNTAMTALKTRLPAAYQSTRG